LTAIKIASSVCYFLYVDNNFSIHGKRKMYVVGKFTETKKNLSFSPYWHLATFFIVCTSSGQMIPLIPDHTTKFPSTKKYFYLGLKSS